MAAPAAMQPQAQESSNSDNALKVFFAWLPPKEFHRCRCLSRKWATELTSDEMIDMHLGMRGKIQLDYKSVMQYLVLKCCDHRGTGAYTESGSEEDGEMAEQTDINNEGDHERSKTKESSGDANQETNEKEEDGEDDDDDGDNDDDDADDEDEEDNDWREEYRIKGYVAVDKEYYVRRAEMQAWANEQWGKIDFSGLTVADSDDELLKACTVTLGALHPRIRISVLETEEDIDIIPIRGREKTDEEVDHEIIAFLVGLRNMDPQPQFLKELNTYRYPWPVEEYDSEEVPIGQGDNLEHSDEDVDVEDSSADYDYGEEPTGQLDRLEHSGDGEVAVEDSSADS
ncbi:unnamed protein product [Alopecurus aequalis]